MGTTVRPWSVAVGVALACLGPDEAPAAAPVPVHLTVHGEGPPVRVQVYASPGECLSEGDIDRKLLDEMVAVGATARTETGLRCVCYRHTKGYFRQIDFTPLKTVCTHGRRHRDPSFDGKVLRIAVPADAPPGWRPDSLGRPTAADSQAR